MQKFCFKLYRYFFKFIFCKNYIEKKGNALRESLLITSIWKYKITQQ